MSNSEIPKQYRVNENGEVLDFKPTLLKAAFAGVAILAVAIATDHFTSDCSYLNKFIGSECSIAEQEQGQAVSAAYPLPRVV